MGDHINKEKSTREFIKLFEYMSRTDYRVSIFDAFLEYSVLHFKKGVSANDFEELNKRWKPEYMGYFKEMFLIYGDIADNVGQGFSDPLGDIFMECVAKSDQKYRGQFFTPECICEFMAQLTHGDKIEDGKWINDPACGSGRTLLSVAKINRNLIFFGADIDETCCKMTLLNMLSNSLTCEIAHMNSISMDHFKTWQTGTHYSYGVRLPYYVEVPKEETIQIQMWERKKKEYQEAQKKNTQTQDGNTISKNNQISLF